MGHYDEYRKEDEREVHIKEEKKAKEDLQELVDHLSHNQKLVAIDLLKNLDSIRGMLNFLRNCL